MAKKSKDPQERKPDLHEADNQAEIETRIKEMMEFDEPQSSPKPIAVTMHEADELVSAPKLPSTKKSLNIKVIDHNELASVDLDSDESLDPEPAKQMAEETDPEVLAAIEAANKQLLSKETTAGEAGAVADEATDTAVSETQADLTDKSTEVDPASAQTAPELDSETTDEAAPEPLANEIELSDPEPEPDITAAVPFKTTEDSEPTTVLPKDKPLKHLDSIVPKTKVEQAIESDSTSKAVDDIVAKEADALMEAEDAKLATAFQPEPKSGFGKKLSGIFKKKAVRRVVLLSVLAGLIAAAVVPSLRYYALNAAGIRSSASLTVLDESTRQPLKGVTVKLGSLEQMTDQNGSAQFSGVRLGATQLTIEKRAFATVSKNLIIGWGSNPLGEFESKPTGSQYIFKLTDFLSGKPIAKVEAASNEASALSNEDGEIKLTIDQQDDTPREVTISADGYRQEKFSLNLDQKESLELKLVPNRKHVFISNRSGKFNVYKVDIDGQNEKLVLPGTGSEREDMVLAPHPSEEIVALVSTKDGKRNKDGFLLSTLTVMNLNEETNKSVVTSERVQIIDWLGSRIVYVQVKEGASGDSPDRHKLMSYDYKSQEYKELASSNYFNDVLVANGQIYVAPSSTYSQSTGSSLLRINADGSAKQTIINQEVWNIFRTSYEKLILAVQQDWYELKLGENQPGKLSGEPPSQTSRIYADSPDKKRSLWVENRDGKGVLLVYDSETKQDNVIRTQGGLRQPVRWLTNSTLIFRVSTESETADYALNVDGGEPVKVRDVTNTSAINTWYFY